MLNLLKRFSRRRGSLQTQLTALLLIVSIIPLLWMAYFAYTGGRRALENSIGVNLAQLAKESIDKADMSLFWRLQQVRTAASNAEGVLKELSIPVEERKRAWNLKQAVSPKAVEIVNGLAILAGEDGKVILTDRNGLIVHANQWVLDFDQSSESWWRKAYNNGIGYTYIGRIKYDPNVKVHSIDIAVPVMDKGTNRAIGVLEVTFILSDLRDMVQRLNGLMEGMEAYIIDEQGRVVAAPPDKKIRILQDRMLYTKAAMEAIQASNGEYGYVTEEDETGEKKVIGWAHSAGYMGHKLTDWSVLVFQPTSVAFAPASRLKNNILLLTVLSAVVVAFIGVGFTRRLTKPIISLAEAARAIGQGTFEADEIPITSRNEVGVLVEEFNLMRKNLRELMGKLADEQEKMKAVVNSIAEGLVFLDKRGRIVHLNPAAEELLGMRGEDVGSEIGYTVDDPTLKRLFESCQLSTHQRKTIAHEVSVKRRGKERILKVLASPVISEDGILLGTVYVFDDITREREIDKMKSDFVNLVSHELRTPLTTIQLGISLILDEKVGRINDRQRSSLEKVDRQVKRLTRLINDLLDLSRIESGRVQMKREPISLLDIVVARLEEIKPQAETKGIKLNLDVKGEIPMTVGDEERIGQVVTNLLSNAVKFTPSGGSVTVRITPHSRMLLTEVIDTGPGIPPDKREKIFDKFYQLSDINTRQQGGSGLGLSIAKSIIEAHNGKIWVESEEGKGSNFKFLLPLIPPEELEDGSQDTDRG
jgi:PAS domain S-box-containing protein